MWSTLCFAVKYSDFMRADLNVSAGVRVRFHPRSRFASVPGGGAGVLGSSNTNHRTGWYCTYIPQTVQYRRTYEYRGP
jgi:hypothetical protein